MSELNYIIGHSAGAEEFVGVRKHFRAIKRNKLLICAMIWMELKEIMLSEKGSSLNDSTNMAFSKGQHYTYGEEICYCQGLGKELGEADGFGSKEVAQGIFVVMK